MINRIYLGVSFVLRYIFVWETYWWFWWYSDQRHESARMYFPKVNYQKYSLISNVQNIPLFKTTCETYDIHCILSQCLKTLLTFLKSILFGSVLYIQKYLPKKIFSFHLGARECYGNSGLTIKIDPFKSRDDPNQLPIGS